MSIKEAKQSGSQVLIKNDRSSSTQVTGILVGYTSKSVFVVNGHNVNIYTDNGSSFKSIGTSITLNGGEAVMCGNCIGIKKNGRINLYDENGKSAGSKNA